MRRPLENLKEFLNRDKVIPVIGAGFSYATAGLPGWKGALENGFEYAEIRNLDAKLREAGLSLLAENRLTDTANKLKSLLNAPNHPFSNWLDELFGNPVVQSQALLDLNPFCIKPLLEAFYDELVHTKLNGFAFANEQFVVQADVKYENLKTLVANSDRIDIKRLIKKLESWLVEGSIIILNYADLKDKMIHDAYQACFWFTRAMRYWIICGMRQVLSEIERKQLDYGRDTFESPMVGRPDDIEKFYNSELIKVDLWRPEDSRGTSTSVYLSTTGYAGAWFAEHFQLSGPYTDHFSPAEFYNFILPQMVMRHFIYDERIIEDWTGYYIGCA